MIIETSDSILAQLKTIDGPKTIDDWGGEIDDLIKQAAKLPGMFLVLGQVVYQPKENIGGNRAKHDDQWTVVIIAKSLRGKDAASPECYALIEAQRTKLHGFNTGNGYLWPVSEALIHSEKGKLVYACEYTLETETP